MRDKRTYIANLLPATRDRAREAARLWPPSSRPVAGAAGPILGIGGKKGCAVPGEPRTMDTRQSSSRETGLRDTEEVRTVTEHKAQRTVSSFTCAGMYLWHGRRPEQVAVV
jgi:hypothetical protein